MGFEERAREVMARLEAAEAAFDAREQADRAAEVEAETRRAARARTGELGPVWQQVQHRIDLGETSVEAIFSGEDDSAAARALREQSQKNLQSLSDAWRDQDEDGDGTEPSPAALASRASAESDERFSAAMQRITDALRSLDRRPDRTP